MSKVTYAVTVNNQTTPPITSHFDAIMIALFFGGEVIRCDGDYISNITVLDSEITPLDINKLLELDRWLRTGNPVFMFISDWSEPPLFTNSIHDVLTSTCYKYVFVTNGAIGRLSINRDLMFA